MVVGRGGSLWRVYIPVSVYVCMHVCVCPPVRPPPVCLPACLPVCRARVLCKAKSEVVWWDKFVCVCV